MGELANEGFHRHAVLQGHAGEGADAVHEAADGGAFLGHRDEEFAGLTILEEADVDVAFVAGDLELVVDGATGLGQAAAQRHAGLFAERTNLLFKLLDAGFERRGVARGDGGFGPAFVGLLGVERLAALGAVAIDGDAFEAHLPGLLVGVADVGDGGFVGQVDGLADGAADEGLGRAHHLQVRHVLDAALAFVGFESAVEHGEMLVAESAGNDRAVVTGDIFDGVVLLDVRDDGGDLILGVTETMKRLGHSAIDDLQHAAAGEEFVFHQRDVGFDASGVAVHEEGDGAGGREDGDLRVAVAVLPALFQSAVPSAAGFVLEVAEVRAGLNFFHGISVKFDDAEHGFDVVLLDGLAHAGAAGVAVAREGAAARGDVSALLVGFAGHDGGEGTGERAAFVAVVGQAVAHDERAKVREAEAEGAEDVRILRNFLGGIAGVVNEEFLRGDVDAHGGLVAFDVERAVFLLELHQVQGGEIAGGVVEEDVFAARIGAVNRLSAFAGVPLLDRAVVLQPGVAADVRAGGDFVQQRGGVFLLKVLALHGLRPPFPAGEGGGHELVADADGKVFVLIHDGAVGVAVVAAIVALLDERPGLALFPLLAVDEFLDVAMPVAEGVHLGGATGLAAGLHDVGDLIIDLEEAEGAAGATAAGELLAAAADGGKISAGAGAVLEEHGLAVGEVHDALHVVIDGLDEARAALRIFVLGRGALGDVGLAIEEPVALGAVLADAVLGEEADVEPDRRVEGAVLIHAEPGEFVVEDLAVLLAEVTVLDAPVRDGAGDAVDQLLDAGLALGGVLLAVKVFRDDDLGGELRPELGHFDAFLLKDDLAGVVGDFSSAFVPFDLVEGTDLGITEHPLDAKRLFHGSSGTRACLAEGGRLGAAGGTCRR